MSNHRFTFLTTAVMVVLLAATAAVAVAADGPKMVVPEKIKDMGKVAQGYVINVDFAITNEGDETLEIKAVRPTCGCTVADFDREIAPGKTGYIKAKLETRDFSGPISKSILIMTNDPRDPTTTVVIKTVVHPYVQILPRALERASRSPESRARCRSSSPPFNQCPLTSSWRGNPRSNTRLH
jgi:hypothetical protein